MNLEPCPTLPLVEAMHDGRLGDREVASVNRHLRGCASCTEQLAALATLRRLARQPEEPLPPIEHQRARLRLLREAARGESEPPRRPLVPLVAVAALVVAGGLCAFLWGARADRGAAPAAGIAGPVGTAAGRAETTVRASEGAVFSRHTELGSDVISLSAGQLDIAARKLGPGERFLVTTADAEVEVRGTRFQVVAAAGHLMLVSVEEGRVEVRARHETTLLEPGDEWRAASIPAAAGSESTSPAGSSTTAPIEPSVRPSATVSAAPRQPPSAKTAAPAGGAASSEFRDAVKRMEKGDYGAAAEQLGKFADANPKDARAEDAAFLAVLSLQRAGRRAEAAAAARRYLAAYPNGYRRAEAGAIAGQ